MEIKTISNRSKKVILFFADWGMDHNQHKHLQGGNYDIIIISNYQTLSCPAPDCSIPDYSIYHIIKNYRQINVIAQGAGVWAACALFDNMYHTLSTSSSSNCGKYRLIRLLKKMGKAIAIDGTLCPVSNIWGIPQQRFNSMIGLPAKTPQELKTLRELEAFRENYFFSNAIVWSKAIISRNNPLFPAANQQRFWSEYNLCTDRNNKLIFSTAEFSIDYIEKSHFPFDEYEKWESILDF